MSLVETRKRNWMAYLNPLVKKCHEHEQHELKPVIYSINKIIEELETVEFKLDKELEELNDRI